MGRGRQTKKRTNNRNINLVYNDGYIMNEHRVVFTIEEKKALENAVTKANYRRNKQIAQFKKSPHNIGDRQISTDKGQLYVMGKDPDMIITKKTKSLQRFKTKDSFNKYLDYLNKVNSDEYLYYRTKLYQSNYILAVKSRIDDARYAEPIVAAIERISPEAFYEMSMSNEVVEIDYVYTAESIKKLIMQLNDAFHAGIPQSMIDQIDEHKFYKRRRR